MPSRLLGVTVRWPARAAWAAFWASRSSFFPRRRRSCLVGGRDLEDHDLCLLHKAQEPCAVAAGRRRFRCAEAHRRESIRRRASGDSPAGVVGKDPVFRGSYPAHRLPLRREDHLWVSTPPTMCRSRPSDDRHSQPPDWRHALTGFTGTEMARTGLGSRDHGGQALLGSSRASARAKPHRKAFPGGRQVRGKDTTWSI